MMAGGKGRGGVNQGNAFQAYQDFSSFEDDTPNVAPAAFPVNNGGFGGQTVLIRGFDLECFR